MKKTIQLLGSFFIASMILLTSCSKEEINKNKNTSTQQNSNLQLFLDQDFVQLYNADNDFIELLENLNIEEGEDYENLLINLENVETENDLLSALNGYGPINNNDVLDYLVIRQDLSTRIFNEYPELLDLTNSQLSEYWAQEWLVLRNMATIDAQYNADVSDCKSTRNRDAAILAGGSLAAGVFGTPAAGGAVLILGVIQIRAAYNQCMEKAYGDLNRRK